MRIECGKAVRSVRNSFDGSRVVGIRASDEFWKKVQGFADRDGDSKNAFVIKVLLEYMEMHDGTV